MLSRIHLRTLLNGAMALGLIALLSLPAHPQAPSSTSPAQQSQTNSASGAGTGQRLAPAPPQRPDIKPDPKKAKEAYKLGLHAEQDGDWQAAFDNYEDAENWGPLPGVSPTRGAKCLRRAISIRPIRLSATG
jgi:hypothetical protein